MTFHMVRRPTGVLFAMELTHLVGHVVILMCLLTRSSPTSETGDRCESRQRKCHRVTALVPARAGSKGIPDKNLSVLGDETLLGRSLRVIQECDKFDSVWVSTDGDNIANVARAHGANVHWRDPKTATDNATSVSAVEDFLSKHKETDIVAVIQCTSPFIRSDFLCQAVDYIMRADIDCVFSVTKSHQLRWTLNKDGFVTPINFNPQKRPRRQDWDGEFVENGMFYILKSKLITESSTLQNNRCRIFEIPKRYSMEIDSKDDLALARLMLQTLGE